MRNQLNPHSLDHLQFLGPLKKVSLQEVKDVADQGVLATLYLDDVPSEEDMARLEITPENFDEYPWGVIGRHGLFRYGRRADGRVVVIMAEDHDHIDPILKPKWMSAFYPGAYLQEKNLSHIFAVSARSKRSRSPWVRDEIVAFERAFSHYQQNIGMLCRLSQFEWRSDHLVYRLTELNKKEQQKYRPDISENEKVYCLRLFTSGGPDSEPVEINSDSILVKRFNLGPKSIYVTMDEAEIRITYDFNERTKAILRGYDPVEVGPILEIGQSAPTVEFSRIASDLEKPAYLARKFIRSFRRGLDNVLNKVPEKRGSIVYWSLQILSTFVAAGFKALAQTSKTALLSELASGLALKLKTYNEGRGTAEYDHSGAERVDSFLRKGRKPFKLGPYVTYGKADPEELRRVQLLRRKDVRIYMQGGTSNFMSAQQKIEYRKQWALNYILSTDKAPFGTERLYFEKNGHKIIVDNQTNGLRVIYCTGNIRYAFAEYDESLVKKDVPVLDRPVFELVKNGPVMVCENVDRRLSLSEFGTKEKMIDSILKLLEVPAEPLSAAPSPISDNSMVFKPIVGHDAERKIIESIPLSSTMNAKASQNIFDAGESGEAITEAVLIKIKDALRLS